MNIRLKLLLRILFAVIVFPLTVSALTLGGDGGTTVIPSGTDVPTISVGSGCINLENDEQICNATNDTITMTSVGGANNDTLSINLDDPDFGPVLTATGGSITFGTAATMKDTFKFNFGSAGDSSFVWTTAGNDNLQIVTSVGSTAQSGYFSFIETAGFNDVDRSPDSAWVNGATPADPTWCVHSADAGTDNLDQICTWHDQTNAKVANGAGDIIIDSAGAINLDPVNGNFILSHSGTKIGLLFGRTNLAQFSFGLDDSSGNQLVITSGANSTKDHDHALSTNPLLCVQSDLDPDVSNNQFGCSSHDQEDFIIETGVNVGTGSGATTDNNGIIFKPRGTEQARIQDTGIIARPPDVETIIADATITANACGTIKLITAAGAVTTDTTDTFSDPTALNDGCIMHVCNTGAQDITLDNNAKFVSAGGADIVVGPNDCLIVGASDDDGLWYQMSALLAN